MFRATQKSSASQFLHLANSSLLPISECHLVVKKKVTTVPTETNRFSFQDPQIDNYRTL